uniref:Chemerin chemokine-like receptor 1 n=1 Tax=Neogobius melanostomus TaxID=47308 RepID=A0A8C6TPB7_9GOBI
IMDSEYKGYNKYTSPNITDYGPTSVLAVVNIMTCVLGLAGNSLVIWICGWKMKKTKMNKKVIMTWYISLAVSNLLFCAFLPTFVYYFLTYHWPFGSLLCKLTYFMLNFNMYSSVFLLVLISVDRFVLVMFPVWSRNHRSPWKASVMVAAMWTLSALLSFPTGIYSSTIDHKSTIVCYPDYNTDQRRAIALTRFFCGLVSPFLIIAACGVGLVMKLKNKTLKSAKPYKIMSALIGSFFVCLVPYHIFKVMAVDHTKHDINVIITGMKVGQTLAAANSIISTVLYVFLDNEFRATLKQLLASRTEAALADLPKSKPKKKKLATH